MLWIVMKYKLPVISTYHNYWCEWNYKKLTYSNVADKNNLMYLKYSNKYKSILFSMYDWFLTTWKWSSGWWHCSILVLANVFGREWPPSSELHSVTTQKTTICYFTTSGIWSTIILSVCFIFCLGYWGVLVGMAKIKWDKATLSRNAL